MVVVFYVESYFLFSFYETRSCLDFLERKKGERIPTTTTTPMMKETGDEVS